MILVFYGLCCFLSYVCLIGLIKVMSELVLYMCFFLNFYFRYSEVDVIKGRLELCFQNVLSVIWSQILKSDFLGFLSNVLFFFRGVISY